MTHSLPSTVRRPVKSKQLMKAGPPPEAKTRQGKGIIVLFHYSIRLSMMSDMSSSPKERENEALKMALEALKEKCQRQQRRIDLLEEENQSSIAAQKDLMG